MWESSRPARRRAVCAIALAVAMRPEVGRARPVATLQHPVRPAPVANARTRWGPSWSWLPDDLEDDDPWALETGARVPPARMDHVVYHGRVVRPPVTYAEPADARVEMLLGPAGPERGRLVYDERRAIVFYTAACCSSGRNVLALATGIPKRFVRTDLAGTHTQRGIRLGDSSATVRRIDGPTDDVAVRGRPELRRLSYVVTLPGTARCYQTQNFVFRRDRLVYIDFIEGC